MDLCNDRPIPFPEWMSSILEAKDTTMKIRLLKQYYHRLFEKNIATDHFLRVLLNLYLNADNGSALRKCLQGVFESLKDYPKDCLVAHIRQCFAQLLQESATGSLSASALRPILDTSCTIIDQLPFGDGVAAELIDNVVRFIQQALHMSYQRVVESTTAHDTAVELHNCLACLLLVNKMLQKVPIRQRLGLPCGSSAPGCNGNVTSESDAVLGNMFDEVAISSDTVPVTTVTHSPSSSVITERLQEPVLLSNFVSITLTSWHILARESAELDCQAAAGICIGVTLQLILGQHQLVEILFSEHQRFCVPLPASNEWLDLGKVQVSSVLCVYAGLLATLSLDTLTSLSAGGQPLLEYVGLVALQRCDRLENSKARLSASRCVLTLSIRAIECLQAVDVSVVVKKYLLGNGKLAQACFTYVCMNWDDPMDVIRHNVNDTFRNLIYCHLLASGEDPQESSFLASMADKLLAAPWHQKGKYEPLTILLKSIGSRRLLQQEPRLVHFLLDTMAESALAVHDLCKSEASKEAALATWSDTWVRPICGALSSPHCTQVKYANITQLALPRLLKHCSGCLPAFVDVLGDKNDVGPLVTVLKAACSVGVLKRSAVTAECISADREPLWHGLVPLSTLKLASGSLSDKVRMDMLALLCENVKLAEVVSECDLELVTFFLQNNMYSQSPSFRQHLVALCKKLFIRLREGQHSFLRSYQLSMRKGSAAAEALLLIKCYKDFFLWLMTFLFDHLHPGVCFSASATALSLLATLTKVFLEGQLDGEGLLFHPSLCVDTARLNTLLYCLTHSFETNKSDSLYVIKTLCVNQGLLQAEHVQLLLTCCMDLSSTTRPQDGSTTAHLLQVVIGEESSFDLLLAHTHAGSGDSVNRNVKLVNSVASRCYMTIDLLLCQLTDQVTTATNSLLEAAGSKPIYPTIFCIRHVLENFNFGLVNEAEGVHAWQKVIERVVDACMQVARLVAPVVAHCSPEGNIVMETDVTDASTLDDIITQSYDGDTLTSTDTAAVKVMRMPEFLTVCGWRCVKEVSLLLGHLVERAPIADDSTTSAAHASRGLLTVDQVLVIGQFFISQLTDARHRGAFELAYAGFVKATGRLWRSPIVSLAALPQQWLDNILLELSNEETSAKLCATRRSAGVPFLIQAILGTEPPCVGMNCSHRVMKHLLDMATPGHPSLTETTQVHALNILRALFRDARLGGLVTEYVSQGLQVAILGQGSDLWAVRNSATLLFNSLVIRMFGVKRAREELAKNNCLTGSSLFHRYPALYDFLLNQLTLGSADQRRHQLSPALYTALTVLSRLTSSTADLVNTNCSLQSFLPHIVKCAGSPIYKVRVMASHALRPVVTADNIGALVDSLLSQLPVGGAALSQNRTHGLLLQLHQLLGESILSLADKQQVCVDTVAQRLLLSHWLLSHNSCHLTRSSYVDVCCDVVELTVISQLSPAQSVQACISQLLQQANHELDGGTNHMAEAGYSVYVDNLIARTLRLGGLTWAPSGDLVIGLHDTCLLLSRGLRSDLYEVRSAALNCLARLYGAPLAGADSSLHEGDEEDVTSVSDDASASCKLRTHLAQQLDLWTQVAAMVAVEFNASCLAQVLQVLCTCVGHHCQVDTRPFIELPTGLITRVTELISYDVDAVSYSALELLGLLLPHCVSLMTAEEVGGVLRQLSDTVEQMSSSNNAVEFRIACANVLLHNIGPLLLDSTSTLGDRVFSVWGVLLRLHYDEDFSVRTVAANIAQRLHGDGQHSTSKQLSDSGSSVVLSDVAVQSTLATFTTRWGHVQWTSCLDTLLHWTLHDIEPDWLSQDDSEQRLFDKGESNTYRDDMNLVRLVARELRKFLSRTLLSGEQEYVVGCDTTSTVSRCHVIDRRALQLLSDFDACITRLCAIDRPFTKQPQYTSMCEQAYRQLSVLGCLVTGVHRADTDPVLTEYQTAISKVLATLDRSFMANCLLLDVLPVMT